jgi:choline-glycine betaine transporter
MWHFNGYSTPRFSDLNDNERANHSLMITYFHWGIHGWVPYVIIGALMAIMSYRRGLPMTMRSCFYPLWGKGIEGWRGDLVDVISIVCTLFGVCTSLGLGVRQLNMGLVRLDRGRYAGSDLFGGAYDEDPPRKAACVSDDCTKGRLGVDFDVRTQCLIIAFVTLLATCSVLSGLHRGIAVLSYVSFCLGMVLVTSVLFMGDTMYILDAICSSFGFYLWYLPKISWETDAWARAGAQHDWEGNTPGRGAIGIQGNPDSAYGPPDGLGAGEGWMHAWTIFYWGWWISWGPFVGTFLARISKGRRLGEFILFTLIMPTLYCVFWFGVLGSEGIRMQFEALRGTDDFDCGFSPPAGDTLSTRMAGPFHAKHNQAYTVNLWCLSTEDVLFDQLGSYGSRQLSYVMTGWAWVGLLLYFITSSDSGSFTMDMIAANGDPHPPKIQTVIWSFTEGLAAIALVKGAGGDSDRSLRSLQAVSVVAGLPFTVVLMYMIHALWIACREEAGEIDEERRNFRTQCVPGTMSGFMTFVGDLPKIAEAVFLPWLPVGRNLRACGVANANVYSALSGLIFYFAIVLLAMCPIEANLRMISGAWYLAFATIVAYTRYATRQFLKIQHGDLLTDMCIATLFYPLALVQHDKELAMPYADEGPDDEKKEAEEELSLGATVEVVKKDAKSV